MVKVQIIAGSHIEQDDNGNDVLYSYDVTKQKGDVFMSHLDDIHLRWPEKFRKVEDYVPVTQNVPTIAGGNPKSQSQSDQARGDRGDHSSLQPPPPPKQHQVADYQTLERMTVKELQSYAEEEEIDLHGSTKREDMLKTLKPHVESQARQQQSGKNQGK